MTQKDELKNVAPDQILINPYQPRREFKAEELEELAQSILSVGLIHPPLVRPLEGSSTQFELISGERRLRAARLANLSTIPVVVRQTNSTLSAQAALIENVQRVDLNPLEIAKALKQLMGEFGFNQEDLAGKIGKKRSTVANYLRLLNLPSLLQESISKGCITMGHAKAILSLDAQEKQMLLHEQILHGELTVREAEQAALRMGEKTKKHQPSYTSPDFNLKDLERKIEERLGTKACLQTNGKQGRLLIDYYDLDDLDRILEILGIKQEI